MKTGLYESLITIQLKEKLSKIDRRRYYVADEKSLDEGEAVFYLSRHLYEAITNALHLIKRDRNQMLITRQIEIANNLLKYISTEIENYDFSDDLIDAEGRILQGVLNQLHSDYQDIKLYLKEITPLTRLTQSELFTGGNVGLSLVGELKKEIRSSDRIDLLVSFIKWKAIVILREAFQEFTDRGGQLRVITTTYMGATDFRAVEELNKLVNTTIKISYNTANERLHAKAYLFYRNTGFHTGYIGSSNFSRSALTDGLEWNVKVTTSEIPHIIDKFQKTFESYWNDSEFKTYNDDEKTQVRLQGALKTNKAGKSTDEFLQFFDIRPYHYQLEILEKLQAERKIRASFHNLIVAATGTGKTMLSAFDFQRYLKHNSGVKFLFIAHRIEILRQSLSTFRHVLKDQNFGEILGDGQDVLSKKNVFASIQTMSKLDFQEFWRKDYYDYIVIDEVHHVQAKTYQKVISYFTPKILLGLTATPERMDGKSILPDFNNRIAAEIRLPDAINKKLLCPFHYFGISDSVDYTDVTWVNGKYDQAELTKIYTRNDIRVRDIMMNLDKYTRNFHEVRAIGFCAGISHAKYMDRKFREAGLKSAYLVSENSTDRLILLNQFKSGEINYLFVVDMFNEGVDIPQIDTVLFLRPTESLTIFLQQLGRGLRLHDGKDILTVLDFVGNAREEYDFATKFRALIGKTNTAVASDVEKDFPHLPLGCSIILEKKAKEYILNNIRRATRLTKQKLIQSIQLYPHHTELPRTLGNFMNIYNLRLQDIYKNYCFTTLIREASGHTPGSSQMNRYKTMLSKKWIATESYSYFRFIQKLIEVDFHADQITRNKEDQLMCLMVYYDFYQSASSEISLQKSILNIGQDKEFVKEMKEFIEVKMDQISFEEHTVSDLGYAFPLRVYARYTREQILVAMQLSVLSKKSSNREGVALNSRLNTEALFINLEKTEEDFSPTTMYDDYAINEQLFHWQSQNQTTPESEKGLSYIRQNEQNKIILLFVRESKKDEYGFTRGYVFLGPANYISHLGSKPMSITWKLQFPIPDYLWTESAKMMVG